MSYIHHAEQVIRECGLRARPPHQRGPFPSDVAHLANVMARAERIMDGIDLLRAVGKKLDDPETRAEWEDRRLVMRSEVALRLFHGPFGMAVLATRPWGDTDPADLGLTDEDLDHYLLPLALALAGSWRRYWPSESDEARTAKRDALTSAAELRGWTEDEAKAEAVRRGVLLAHAARSEGALIRPGRYWITDAEGRKRDAVPYPELASVEYLRWWRAEVYRQAEGVLRSMAGLDGLAELEERGCGEYVEIDPTLPADDPLPLDSLDAHAGPLAALMAAARDEGERRALGNATPRGGEVLDAMLAHLGRGTDVTAAKKATAAELGMKANTVEQHLSRLRPPA